MKKILIDLVCSGSGREWDLSEPTPFYHKIKQVVGKVSGNTKQWCQAPQKGCTMLYILVSIMMAALAVILISCIVKVREEMVATKATWALVLNADACGRWLNDDGLTPVITKVHRAMTLRTNKRILRDPELWIRNIRWDAGPTITTGPNRTYRRAHNSALQASGKARARAISLSSERRAAEAKHRAEEALLIAIENERLRLLRLEQERERIAAYVAANTNRLRASRRWEKKGTPVSSSTRTKRVVQATVYVSKCVLARNEHGQTNAQVRANNLEWAMARSARPSVSATSAKARRSDKRARKSWALLESRTFRAIQQGDSSPETMALYRAARAA